MSKKLHWTVKVRRTIEEEFVLPVSMTAQELCPFLESVMDKDVSIPEKITQEWLEQNISPWRLLDVMEQYSNYDPANFVADKDPSSFYCADVYFTTCEFDSED